MEVKAGKRTFKYNNIPLADPDVKLSVQQVRDFYANIYPEITTAEIDGPENKGGDIVYTFRRAVGTKGGNVITECKKLQAVFDIFYDGWIEQMEKTQKEEFPVGREVQWRHGAHFQQGRVTRHGYAKTVFVKNERTGVETRRDVIELELL